jgi:hypothetical protein
MEPKTAITFGLVTLGLVIVFGVVIGRAAKKAADDANANDPLAELRGT